MNGFLNPEEILDQLEIKDSLLACEFGCGAGLFTIALAKRLKMGRVYGLDIQEEKLSALKSKATLDGFTNVETILCDLEAPKGSKFQHNFLDIVLVPNVLFQAEKKDAIIEEAKRILKPGGQLLIIDWAKIVPFGPKQGLITAEDVKKLAEKLGLKLKKEFPASAYHYGLLFIKE